MDKPWAPRDDLQFETILYEKQGNVATVTLNRPRVYNALNFPILRELARAFEDASWDDRIAVVVVTGAGDRAFCTGADLNEQEGFLTRPQDYWKWMGAFIEMHDRLRNIGKPTIARLNGMTVGGGNELNMSCDLAIAADHVVIRQVGPARGSVPAAGATQWLPLIVGDRRAREILWLCEPIPAQQALEWGLVNRVVPMAELDAAVAEMAAKIADRMPEIIRYTRAQTNFWKDFSWGVTVQHARDWLAIHSASAEVREGLQSFHEKRPVNYAGLRERLVPGHEYACPNCGATDLPPDHAFCGRCGAKLGDRG